jgi:hypothetical protein
MATNATDKVIFSIVFKKGLADKNRLPLSHVIKTLQHIEQMIRDVGRQIQRDAGAESPDGDFGIALLAGKSGLAFRKGSYRTAATMTRDVANGILAINTLINTTDALEHKAPLVTNEHSEQILRRLPRISEIQEQDNTELHLSLSENNHVVNRATLGQKGRETLRKLETLEAGLEGITLYGKLRELKDINRSDETSGFFWGELLEDNGRTWRVRFKDSDQKNVLALFRKQVSIVGDATYFRTKTPRVDVANIEEETFPDYMTAFDEFRDAYADVFQDRKADEILDDIRE